MILIALAITGGIFLAIQGGLNAQLGVMLKNPLMAASIAFAFSTVLTFAGLVMISGFSVSMVQIKQVPVYLWFTGAIFSVAGISIYYYTIPRLGISSMISLGLSGQLILSVIAGHFGWFNMPQETINLQKIMGIVAMISAIILINKS